MKKTASVIIMALCVLSMIISASAAGTADVKVGKAVDVDSKIVRTVYTDTTTATGWTFKDGWFFVDALRDMTDSYPVLTKYPSTIANLDAVSTGSQTANIDSDFTQSSLRTTIPHSILGPLYAPDKTAGVTGIMVMWPFYTGIDAIDRGQVYYAYEFEVKQAGTYQLTIVGTAGTGGRGVAWMMDDGERRQTDGTFKTDGTEGSAEGNRIATFSGEALTYELTAGKHTFYMLLNENHLVTGSASGRYNLAGFVVEPLSTTTTTTAAITTATPGTTKAPVTTTPSTSDGIVTAAVMMVMIAVVVSAVTVAKKAKKNG